MRTILLLLVGITIPTAAALAQGYSVTTTTTTTTTRQADGTTRVETTQSQSVPYSQGRCQRLMLDQNMLLDQLRRTGWKLEQDGVRAQLTQVQEEIVARGC